MCRVPSALSCIKIVWNSGLFDGNHAATAAPQPRPMRGMVGSATVPLHEWGDQWKSGRPSTQLLFVINIAALPSSAVRSKYDPYPIVSSGISSAEPLPRKARRNILPPCTYHVADLFDAARTDRRKHAFDINELKSETIN